MVTFSSRVHTQDMDECRHGLVAAVCAVCCRAAERHDDVPAASAPLAEVARELAVAGELIAR
jgi:hypothetical protein